MSVDGERLRLRTERLRKVYRGRAVVVAVLVAGRSLAAGDGQRQRRQHQHRARCGPSWHRSA